MAEAGGARFPEAMLFTHRGLSGPAILQISSYWQPGQPLHLARLQVVDTLPDGDRRVQLRNPSARGLWLWKSLPLEGPSWTLHALRRDRSVAAAWSAVAVAVASGSAPPGGPGPGRW